MVTSVMINRKRDSDSKDDVPDIKRGQKHGFTEVSPEDNKNDFYDQDLSDEYQPQFMNYQLVGDLIAIMILHSKDVMDRKKNAPRPILFQNYCHSSWCITDLLTELKSKKHFYPIAKTVILSIGYNDYHENSMSALMLAENIEKVVGKLRRRGCKDIILTNIPPCAADEKSVDHWKYLQIINDEILRLSEKHDYIFHSNIFRLFSTPINLFKSRDEYVTFREVNFKIETAMFEEKHLISFNDLGKKAIGMHLKRSVESRLEYLRRGKISNVICVLEETEDGDGNSTDIRVNAKSELVTGKFVNSTVPSEIIDLEAVDTNENSELNHAFGCTCKGCEDEDRQLMQELLSIVNVMKSVCDEESVPLS